jgi:hypothetical protein
MNPHHLPFYEQIDATLSEAEKMRAAFELNQGITDLMARNLDYASHSSHPAGVSFSHLTVRVEEVTSQPRPWYWHVEVNMNSESLSAEHQMSISATRVEMDPYTQVETDKEGYEWTVHDDIVRRFTFPPVVDPALSDELFSFASPASEQEHQDDIMEEGVSPTEIRNLLAFARSGIIIMPMENGE